MTNSPDGHAELCGRCLVVINARLMVCAKHPNGAVEIIQQATNPVSLKSWVTGLLQNSPEWRFEIGDTAHRFLPIATMYGDPVCAYHLWQLVDDEMHGRR
jgi:hypothetical protein